jgi:hypothetical protein
MFFCLLKCCFISTLQAIPGGNNFRDKKKNAGEKKILKATGTEYKNLKKRKRKRLEGGDSYLHAQKKAR